ncbi:cyclase family protein [Actinocrispum sp. NPDC049592]|uniref:cyclase family protein n=1 Tax=Actinocrispum sp. NPDC049592 TaxID=3154835 RepID=UPI0034354698
MSEWRVQFDAEVTFANGGGLSAREFRLDIPGEDIGDAALGELFVRHLGLLMVDTVTITGKTLIEEPHKGSRNVQSGPVKRSIVDLSHTVHNGMVTHTGLPAPTITDWMSFEDSHGKYAEGTAFTIQQIQMVANTGTYVDAPGHRFEGREDLSRLPLDTLVDLEGIVLRAPGIRAIGKELLLPLELTGKAVLVQTGWDEHWGTPTYINGEHPYLTRAAAEYLAQQRAALVGIDSMNVDDAKDGERPAHTVLLNAGIPIAEHLTNLGSLPPHGFRFFAAPPAVQGMSTFTTRAYAIT